MRATTAPWRNTMPTGGHLPSTVAPLGLAKDGLPVGVQIVAPHYGDLTSIRFAQLLEKQYIGFQAPPAFA